jgi:hypothetical protein
MPFLSVPLRKMYYTIWLTSSVLFSRIKTDDKPCPISISSLLSSHLSCAFLAVLFLRMRIFHLLSLFYRSDPRLRLLTMPIWSLWNNDVKRDGYDGKNGRNKKNGRREKNKRSKRKRRTLNHETTTSITTTDFFLSSPFFLSFFFPIPHMDRPLSSLYALWF